MDTIIFALGPAFAAGLAVQQLLELLDNIVDPFLKILQDVFGFEIQKKFILSLASLLAGLLLAAGAGLRVLAPLGVENAWLADIVVTGLIVSAGTESFNSIVKFLGYAKDTRRFSAKEKAIEYKEKVES